MGRYLMLAALVVVLANGMEHPTNFFLDCTKPITVEQVQKAYLKFAHFRILQSKENEKFLSENLFALSLNWSDGLGVVGLILAKTLIEKGASPHYAHIEEEKLETKSRKMIVSYTQTAMRLAKGKLLDYLKQYALNKPEDEE